MVRQILLLAGVALAIPAFAQNAKTDMVKQSFNSSYKTICGEPVKAKWNDGSVSNVNRAKAPGATVQWKRPAGQFWGVGYSVQNNSFMLYTPLVLRPWTEYTFENISTVQGSHRWDVTYLDYDQQQYVTVPSEDQNVSFSWDPYSMCSAPMLSYPNQVPYASQYYGKEKTELAEMPLCVNENISDILNALGVDSQMPVSSHVWGLFTRNAVERSGFMYYTGAEVYDGMDPEDGMWFGTNNSGKNAMATRFEKPDQPYLLNAVYFYYQFFTDVPKNIPVKAYVFKTVNDAKLEQVNDSVTKEKLELGELIATSESFIPAAVFNENNNYQNAVKFEFFDVDPVSGAKTAVSLEIEDDIAVVVTGYNADLGNGGCLTTFISTDTYDEGYGNLGFFGSLDVGEDGNISYDLVALPNAFRSPMHNTTLGVLADVSYPWLIPYAVEQPSDVHLPNEDSSVEGEQGLQYILPILATLPSEDWELTFNGEDSCDWFDIIEVEDQIYTNENGEEVYDGLTWLLFKADSNPEDVDRTCVVKLSIPAASYTITFRQGSNNDAVEIVGVDGDARYFDLQGRRVANPDKGIYIKKAGNKATKVIL